MINLCLLKLCSNWASFFWGEAVVLGSGGDEQLSLHLLIPETLQTAKDFTVCFRLSISVWGTPLSSVNWAGLKDKFNNRVISRMMDHPWPTKTPNFSPLNYWFLSIAIAKLRRVPHTDIDALKQTVEHLEFFAKSLESEDVKKAVHHLRRRTEEWSSILAELVSVFYVFVSGICILCVCV